MAGIGFSLRKILNHESITRTIAAYTVAGVYWRWTMVDLNSRHYFSVNYYC
ncbi:Uncharacterised protein [Legionella sainthelensi]|nr:Uncharacterised protein [Legionella sainthelensi]